MQRRLHALDTPVRAVVAPLTDFRVTRMLTAALQVTLGLCFDPRLMLRAHEVVGFAPAKRACSLQTPRYACPVGPREHALGI